MAIGKVKALLEQAPETAAPVADDSWQEALQRLTGLVNDLDQGRITSYNVCYTKLLRTATVASLPRRWGHTRLPSAHP